MKLSETQKKRIGIYSFFDKDGIVDGYVEYFLRDFYNNVDELVIVSNGRLRASERDKLAYFTTRVIERVNEGFDIWGYKAGMDYVGWERLCEFDEVILANNTMLGPIYPLSDMFESMAGKDLDFWGITRHYAFDFDPYGYTEYGYVPEHIQSYFMVFRKSMVSSYDFQDYWNDLPMLATYEEAVGYHETCFTKRFADKGFLWDTYVDTEDMKTLNPFPLMVYPKELIRDKKCPIFKRRTFFQPYDWVLENSVGQAASDLMKYLEEETDYPVDLIWDNLLRTCHQEDLVRNMGLTFPLSSLYSSSDCEAEIKKNRVALVMHLYYEDLLAESFSYACAMPETTDVYITTNSDEKKTLIEDYFKKGKFHHLEVRVIANRGRDVSSILVGVKDVIMNYDIACFVHDKKTSQVKPGSVGEGFSYKLFQNTLYNKTFVANVIDTFIKNPRLGILSPPMPVHADYFSLVGNEWGPNYRITRRLAKELGLKVPMDPNKIAIAPYGTFFWFRPEAMKLLYAKDWQYEDFPPEPNKTDGTILHACERIYSLSVQAAGYYPGILLSDHMASLEYTALNYYVREYNKVISNRNGVGKFLLMRDGLFDTNCTGNMTWQEEKRELLLELEKLEHKVKLLERSRKRKPENSKNDRKPEGRAEELFKRIIKRLQ